MLTIEQFTQKFKGFPCGADSAELFFYRARENCKTFHTFFRFEIS